MTATMIDVAGGTVWADDTGGDGRPLVLLHPGVGDSRIWDPVLPALAEKYRVIRYDARGFGQSPAPTVKHSLLCDLVAVLGHYDIERAAIVGCSQGGATALGLALEQPKRVPALVLLCPGIPGFPFGEDDPDSGDALFEEYQRAEAAGDVEAMAAITQGIWGRAGATPEAMEQFRSAARAALRIGELEEEDPAVFDRLGQISVPSSLMVGDADFPPLVLADKAAAATIPGCELILVHGMDHLPPLREPSLVLQTITDTLARASWLPPTGVEPAVGPRPGSVRTTGFRGSDLYAPPRGDARRCPGRQRPRHDVGAAGRADRGKLVVVVNTVLADQTWRHER